MFLRPLTRLRILLPCFALTLVGWLDYVTGPALAFFPFYLLVVALAALRSRWPVAALYSFYACVVFLVVDLLTNPELSRTIFPYWKATGQLISFGLVTFLIPQLMKERQQLTESQAILIRQKAELQTLNERLIATLEELSAAKEKAIEDLLQQHTAQVNALTQALEQAVGLFKNIHTLS